MSRRRSCKIDVSAAHPLSRRLTQWNVSAILRPLPPPCLPARVARVKKPLQRESDLWPASWLSTTPR